MEDKTVLVTGASSGIGFETARGLAARGAQVAIVGRDPMRIEHAAAQLAFETGNDAIVPYTADLSLQRDIRAFAAAFREKHQHLDVLVNNVGAIFAKRELTSEGFERTWALNHLGPFLLTAELMPALMAADAARIINLSSTAQGRGDMDFTDLDGAIHYSAWRAYSRTKLANAMFTFSLAEWLDGTSITANCVHPGLVWSGFPTGLPAWQKPFLPLARLVMISNRQGADNSIYLASAPDVAGVTAKYFVGRKPARANKLAADTDLRQQLWDISVEQTGAKY